MPRSLSIPYAPAPVPNDLKELPRYLEDEFNRIREALIAQPVALAVDENGQFDVTTVISWIPVFIAEPAEWDVPGGTWDPTTGEWTCPQTGLHSIGLQLEVSPFGAGNKTYYAGVAVIVDNGIAPVRYESTDGGDDAIPLGVSVSGLIQIVQGDKVTAEMTIVHDQFTGIADYKIAMQILAASQ